RGHDVSYPYCSLDKRRSFRSFRTTRRLNRNWPSVQMAGTTPRSSVGVTTPALKVQVWRHNAQPQDSVRGSDAYSDADRCNCTAADDGKRSGGQDRAAGAGGGTAASPIFTAGGNLHPDYPPG